MISYFHCCPTEITTNTSQLFEIRMRPTRPKMEARLRCQFQTFSNPLDTGAIDLKRRTRQMPRSGYMKNESLQSLFTKRLEWRGTPPDLQALQKLGPIFEGNKS